MSRRDTRFILKLLRIKPAFGSWNRRHQMAAAQAAGTGAELSAGIALALVAIARPASTVGCKLPVARNVVAARANSLATSLAAGRRCPDLAALLSRGAALATPHASRTACHPRRRRLLAVPLHHRRRYAARRHLAARAPRPWNRAQPPRCRSRAAATRDPRCSTSLGIVRRWRKEGRRVVSHVADVIEGATCINCAATAAAARSGVMPLILYLKFSRFRSRMNSAERKWAHAAFFGQLIDRREIFDPSDWFTRCKSWFNFQIG
ncbi:hypothetical protein C8R45DRAFT_1137320 [Mycena sanguinolenta]|nr:hypothetical protein C8R45DRAFT_1137320 [Mycena sanguinolenta]